MRLSTSQFQTASLRALMEQQSKLVKTQEQLSTGRRVLTPADDPVAASRILNLSATKEELEQLKFNAGLASDRLNAEENALESAGNLLQRVRELTVQGNNATNDADNRRQIASELQQRLDQLVQLANSIDGNGEYLFGGLDSKTVPFTLDASGVSYNGDQGERMVQVGPSRQLPVNHSGFDAFMKIPNGNGDFVSAPAAANTGTGIISPGSIIDSTSTQTYPYTIAFSTNATTGALEYTVTDGATPANTVVAATPYVADRAISFDGVSVAIKGEPAAGDSFTLTESRSQSVFDTVQGVIDALTMGRDVPADRAASANAVNRRLTELDGAMDHILRVRAEVGARLNGIDTEVDNTADSVLDLESSISKLEDLDYAKAISEFNLQLVGLQAAQQTYTQVQGLSLFNFIR